MLLPKQSIICERHEWIKDRERERERERDHLVMIALLVVLHNERPLMCFDYFFSLINREGIRNLCGFSSRANLQCTSYVSLPCERRNK
jgi:hypothetical protein